MFLETLILAEHSKAQANKIIDWIGTDQIRFDELVKLFLGGHYRVTQRAGWPLSYIAAENPQLITKHLRKIVKNLEKPGLHNAVKRNTVRLLQHVEIPKSLQGETMNTCFRFIEDPLEAPAVKAFSLTVLGKLSKLYPKILQEIEIIIASRWDYETAAFKSRAKKLHLAPRS